MKKDKKFLDNILIIILISFVSVIIKLLLEFGVIYLIINLPIKNLSGIENYNKEYYLNEYGGDLDSNLSIFPDDKSIFINPTFKSSMKTGLFDTDGYIILTSKYSKEYFNREVERLSSLSITIQNGCFGEPSSYTNYVKYDTTSYYYPSYITIDGFSSKYEYALVDKNNLEIIYVYLSYPNKYDKNYKEYLKKDKSEYSKVDTLGLFSIYNHSFDNGKSFMEYGDC